MAGINDYWIPAIAATAGCLVGGLIGYKVQKEPEVQIEYVEKECPEVSARARFHSRIKIDDNKYGVVEYKLPANDLFRFSLDGVKGELCGYDKENDEALVVESFTKDGSIVYGGSCQISVIRDIDELEEVVDEE